MYIDSHVHLVRKDWLSKEAYSKMLELNAAIDSDLDYFAGAAILSEYLKTQEIEIALMLMSWHNLVPAGMKSNIYLSDFCQKIKNLIPIAYLEPHSLDEPVKIFETLVKEYGMKGLKLHPPSGFYPNDSSLYPLYAKAQELRLPVFLHIGSSVFPGMRYKYSRPIYLDDIAVDFPELTIVMIHCGRGCDYEAAYFMAKLHKNIFMDISGLPPGKLFDYFPELERNIDKVIFGSDWPAMPARISDNIKAIKNLPLKDSSIEKMLKKNLERLLDKHRMI